MPSTDPRVDTYISKAQPFARPILEHLRAVIHAGCPDVVESIKWSMPAFDYEGPLCGLAAFKGHCAFRFWKGDLLVPGMKSLAMGPFGRIETLDDLPPKRTLIAMVKKAASLNEQGVAAPWMDKRRTSAHARAAKPVMVPADLAEALKKSQKARATFDAFSPSHRREYIEWIESAKRPETRARRLTTAITQMADGKSQNWKYERK